MDRLAVTPDRQGRCARGGHHGGAPACHQCEDANSTLAVLARSYPLTINVVSITDEPGRTLLQARRAPMSPRVLLDGRTSAPGRLPVRKLEKRLAKTQGGASNG
jgi:hypothetical protein